MKILKDLKVEFTMLLLFGIFGFIYPLTRPYAKPQSLRSPSYTNQLILAFFTARLENKQHDAEILKALLMVQEHPSDKIKLAKMCTQFVKDNELKDK